MPTVLRVKGLRFFFFSLENNEPAHVHVEHGSKVAKFWLDPVDFVNAIGFRGHELTKIKALVIENRHNFLEAWNEHFAG